MFDRDQPLPSLISYLEMELPLVEYKQLSHTEAKKLTRFIRALQDENAQLLKMVLDVPPITKPVTRGI